MTPQLSPTSLIIGKGAMAAALSPGMANRHGLVAGATGTGKTVTLRVLVERLSAIGVPTFLADVKGDLSGLAAAGTPNAKFSERATQLELGEMNYAALPVTFWDVLRNEGHPVRATISEMGPLLLARLLDLNEVQSSVLSLVFKIADDHGLMLIDLKDLKALLHYTAEHAKELSSEVGNISATTIAAIQRGVVTLEMQGGEKLFGEPALQLADLLRTTVDGRGVVNVLAAAQLMQTPRVYASLLLWLLSEIYEQLPEVGDIAQPKLVLFFDEAHLLFDDAPKVLLDKVEQVVRLVRSKGVGVFFVTQSPLDIPEEILAQLGNRVQHALRAYTPKDAKAIKLIAQTFRTSDKSSLEKALTELAVGEALVSFLDSTGTPAIAERVFIAPPTTRLTPLSNEERQCCIAQSMVGTKYDQAIDRESAYEKLRGESAPALSQRGEQSTPNPSAQQNGGRGFFSTAASTLGAALETTVTGIAGPRRRQTPIEAMINSAARSIGSQVGRQLIRGVLGSILGGRQR